MNTQSASLRSAVLAGLVAMLPPEVFDYLGKLFSVFVLAVVAECGRRIVTRLWKEKK